jgi:Glycosyltransferase family 29 (sialyltransferase)
MPTLGLGELLRMFAGARSMAVIGNADTILDYENGARIDSYDIVVRFNRAYVDGVEGKVGRRTDILVANRMFSLRKTASPAETIRPRCVVCFVEPSHGIELGAFEEWTGDLPTMVTLAPDLLNATQVERTRPVTMGTDALYTFVNLFDLERLYVSGFTFYGAAGSGPGVYWKEKPKPRGVFHDLEPEARIFASILERFPGEIEATSEVEELRRRYGSAAPEGGASPGSPLMEHLYTRAAWSLISLGMVMRRAAERSRRGRFTRALGASRRHR